MNKHLTTSHTARKALLALCVALPALGFGLNAQARGGHSQPHAVGPTGVVTLSGSYFKAGAGKVTPNVVPPPGSGSGGSCSGPTCVNTGR